MQVKIFFQCRACYVRKMSQAFRITNMLSANSKTYERFTSNSTILKHPKQLKTSLYRRSFQQRFKVFSQQPDFSEKPDYVSPQQIQISDKLMQDMTVKIGGALETENVKVVDAYGDSQHVSIEVVSDLFEGKSAVQRQRMVYKAIWQELQDTVHAVDAMKTLTQEEAAKQQQQ
eukprot:TRINITY_DN19184_c0_g1_i1.p2 TRINITY_DN19184_c0_g1~~TRINITY_DN19184_c0_g1_i1.p2  ORF type:complete len:190 (+),score=16.33 TRINITY_DN19184_c0_g1_i1:54-572(+)